MPSPARSAPILSRIARRIGARASDRPMLRRRALASADGRPGAADPMSESRRPGRNLLDGGTPEEVVLAYHERTKHHPHRYAASPGTMDWATQPDPFRRYEGAPLVRLPLPGGGPAAALLGSFTCPAPWRRSRCRSGSLSTFFRYALSLTAWKRFRGSTWSLRANPSSGNLHPTEGYAVLPQLEGVADGPAVHHYAAKEHGLERRADLDPSAWSALMAGFPPDSFLVGLSSIHWREAWKYGERAFRYCQHDAGHALAADAHRGARRSAGRCSSSRASAMRS